MEPETEPKPIEPFPYKTNTRGLAAALMAVGFELMDIEHGEPEAFFTFPVSRMLLDASDAYFLDTLSVSAFRMGQAMDHLDDLIAGHTAEGEVSFDDL